MDASEADQSSSYNSSSANNNNNNDNSTNNTKRSLDPSSLSVQQSRNTDSIASGSNIGNVEGSNSSSQLSSTARDQSAMLSFVQHQQLHHPKQQQSTTGAMDTSSQQQQQQQQQLERLRMLEMLQQQQQQLQAQAQQQSQPQPQPQPQQRQATLYQQHAVLPQGQQAHSSSALHYQQQQHQRQPQALQQQRNGMSPLLQPQQQQQQRVIQQQQQQQQLQAAGNQRLDSVPSASNRSFLPGGQQLNSSGGGNAGVLIGSMNHASPQFNASTIPSGNALNPATTTNTGSVPSTSSATTTTPVASGAATTTQRFMVDDFAGAGTLLSARDAAQQQQQQARQAELISRYAAAAGNGAVGSNALNTLNQQQQRVAGGGALTTTAGAGGGNGSSTQAPGVGGNTNLTAAQSNLHEHKLNELLFAKQFGMTGMNAAAAAAGLGGLPNFGGLIGGAGVGSLLSAAASTNAAAAAAVAARGLGGVPALQQQQHQQLNRPRTTRLPCQARGMKADHNASTAYFEIPEDARHGQHLLCSHPTCRNAGVKFRYCFYCKKPVTKQNFRSRHLHADLDPNKNKGPNVTAAITNTLNRNSPLRNGDSKKKRTSPGTVNSLSASACQPCDDNADGSTETSRPMKQSRISIKEVMDSPPVYNISRSTHWKSLLDQRPSDRALLHTWIRDVVTAVDPKTEFTVSDSTVDKDDDPSDESGKEDVSVRTTDNKKKRDEWMKLFEERPESNNGKNDHVFMNWLSKVLLASCGTTGIA